MLWDPLGKQLVIIDHNNAFDPEFEREVFFRDHAFRESVEVWGDREYRESRQQKMLALLSELPDIFASFPDIWYSDDEDLLVSLESEVKRAEDILSRIKADPSLFWEVCR